MSPPSQAACAARIARIAEAAVQKKAAVAALLASQPCRGGLAGRTSQKHAKTPPALKRRSSSPFITSRGKAIVGTTAAGDRQRPAPVPSVSTTRCRHVAAGADVAGGEYAEQSWFTKRSRRPLWRGLAVALLVAAARRPTGNSQTFTLYTLFASAMRLQSVPSAAHLKKCDFTASAGSFPRKLCESLAVDNCVKAFFLRTGQHWRTPVFMHKRTQHRQQGHSLPLTEYWQALRSPVCALQARLSLLSYSGFLSYPSVGYSSRSEIYSGHVGSHTGTSSGRCVLTSSKLVTSNHGSTHMILSSGVRLQTTGTASIRQLRSSACFGEKTSRNAAEGPPVVRRSTDTAEASSLEALATRLHKEVVADASARGATAAALRETSNASGIMAEKTGAPPPDGRPAAVLFSPPFPRAVPLAYEVMQPANHRQKQEYRIRQQVESELLRPSSKKQSLRLKDAAAGIGASAGDETADTAETAGDSPAAPVGNNAAATAAARRGEEGDVYPLVVALHGMFRCRDNMKALCARLNAGKVVVADLRCHGDSPFTRTMFMQDMAADVLLLLQHLRERFPHISRCILVGHSLGGQVAMAAAIRSWYANATRTARQHHKGAEEAHGMRGAAVEDTPLMLVEGVATLDICPVNYYRWPLPAAGNGQENVRDLVELVGSLDMRELEEQVRQQWELHRWKNNEDCSRKAAASTQADTSWENYRSRSLLALLVEDNVEEVNTRNDDVDKDTLYPEGKRQSANPQQLCSTQSPPSSMADTRMMQRYEDRRQATMKDSTRASAGGTNERRLRWRMNIQALRDAFDSETMKWDIPLPVQGSEFATAAAAGAVTEGAAGKFFSPTAGRTAAAAGSAAVQVDVASLPASEKAAVECLEREYESVAGFKEPPPTVACGSDRPMLLLRGSCSPWVDVDRHWNDTTAFFPRAELQTVPAAGHALHDDQLEVTAAAINRLLQRVVQKEAA